MHLIVVLATMLILPLLSLALDPGGGGLLTLVLKWFLFWGAGARLAVAGVRQIIAPRLTLEGIFGVKEPRAWPLAQELGFWNLAIGALCLSTLEHPEWRLPLAFAAGAFYAMAGVKHAIGNSHSLESRTALVSDLAIAVVLLGSAAAVLSKGG